METLSPAFLRFRVLCEQPRRELTSETIKRSSGYGRSSSPSVVVQSRGVKNVPAEILHRTVNSDRTDNDQRRFAHRIELILNNKLVIKLA